MTGAYISAETDRELRRRGAITVSLFALIWSLAGSSGFDSPAVRVSLIGLAVVITVLMVVLAIRVDGISADRRPRQLPRNWMRNYNLVGFAQMVVIALVVFGLIWLDQPALIPALVCLVVGIHFFPLVRVFDQPRYMWTGVGPVSYTHLRAHETVLDLVCRLLLEKKKNNKI